MNKEEKKSTLFSSGGVFIDIFIGFLIAACIAGIVYRCFIYDSNAGAQEGTSYLVYFEIADAHPGYADYLGSSDEVYDAQSGLRLGALAVHEQSQQGNVVSILAQDETDRTVTVNGVFRSRPGVMEQGSLVLDGTFTLTPGQELEIYTETVSVTVRIGRIISVLDQPIVQPEQTESPTETQPQTTEESTAQTE